MTNNQLNSKDDVMDDYTFSVSPGQVHQVISAHMLADGFGFVLDLEKSRGMKIVDQLTGREYIDFFTFFASNALGLNHPKLNNETVKSELAANSVNKPSNSDIYTVAMAEFVKTFAEVAKPEYMKYLFFVAGGALAVENGLKVAFDWKVQKNFKKGYTEEKGHKVIHFKQAFHGRSGYTLSLTNTEPNKVKYFPKFDWPRITNPKITFPLQNHLDTVERLEDQAVREINEAIKNNPDDIACIIIEPVQGEGGDNMFRPEFFQKLRQIADNNDILLMYDEVQTGFGMTGKFWASDYYAKPDIISFGKKAQVCGIMVSDRIDDVEEHCFRKSSRINSTWGSDLTDMVRSKHIMQIIKEDNLVENAAVMGKYLLEKLYSIQNEYPQFISGARGLGLMCAFDLPNAEIRNKFVSTAMDNGMIILGCGERSVRFRTPLTVTEDALNEGLNIVRKVLFLLSSNN